MANTRREIRRASWCRTCLLVLGLGTPVAAQPAARLDLTWSGPPGCPSTENVQSRVHALLGGEASSSSVADVRASGQVERVDSGFRLLLTMGVGSTPSSRVIEARSCDELAGAAAIAIALLARSTIDAAPPNSETTPASGASESQERPSPPGPQPQAEAPRRDPEGTPETSPARVQLVIDAPVGVASWGSLPATGLGLGAGVGMRWKALRAVVSGELWLPQTHQVSGFATRFTLQSGRAEACLIQTVQGVELGPCVGGALQRLTGEGIGSEVFSAQSRSAQWVSGLGGIFASLPTPGFAHLRFFGQASVLVSPRRSRFVIDQLGLVHEPSLAAPRLNLGCEWIF